MLTSQRIIPPKNANSRGLSFSQVLVLVLEALIHLTSYKLSIRMSSIVWTYTLKPRTIKWAAWTYSVFSPEPHPLNFHMVPVHSCLLDNDMETLYIAPWDSVKQGHASLSCLYVPGSFLRIQWPTNGDCPLQTMVLWTAHMHKGTCHPPLLVKQTLCTFTSLLFHVLSVSNPTVQCCPRQVGGNKVIFILHLFKAVFVAATSK